MNTCLFDPPSWKWWEYQNEKSNHQIFDYATFNQKNQYQWSVKGLMNSRAKVCYVIFVSYLLSGLKYIIFSSFNYMC
jgi:hypothetical protein